MSKNLSHLSGRKGLEESLFDQYGKLAQENGTPDKVALQKLADEFLMGSANTYGAVTFYDFLKPENQGKKVYVCNGTVCNYANTQDELRNKLQDHFQEDEIGEMCCLGRCHENRAFQYEGKNFSGDLDLKAVFQDKTLQVDKYVVMHQGTQVLTGTPISIGEVKSLLEKLLQSEKDDILQEIDISGLRGRGGAGFPIAKKLDFCRQAAGDTKFIICNADEGDPGAFSDRYLLEEQPLSILLGMMIAGYVTGAEWGVVYIRGEYPESVEIIRNAVNQLSEAGMIGSDILHTGFNFHFKIIQAQGSYICGEETALINSIEGQRPEVRIRPPYPAQEGLFQKPTVVNNVETLAVLPYILTKGGSFYAQLGTERSKGTKLISLDGQFVNPGICEVEMGTPLVDVIHGLGGGFKQDVKALHIGGPLGGIVPTHMIDQLNVDFESFSQHGFLLGHASIVCIPANVSFVNYFEHLFEFAADESCGKCFPCRLGTRRAQEMFHRVQHDGDKIDAQLLDDLLHTLEIGSLCAHGGGIPLPVRNVLYHFKEELAPYLTQSELSEI